MCVFFFYFLRCWGAICKLSCIFQRREKDTTKKHDGRAANTRLFSRQITSRANVITCEKLQRKLSLDYEYQSVCTYSPAHVLSYLYTCTSLWKVVAKASSIGSNDRYAFKAHRFEFRIVHVVCKLFGIIESPQKPQ